MQENISVDSSFALGHVTSVQNVQEQNLLTLFDEGENSQVMQSLLFLDDKCCRRQFESNTYIYHLFDRA